jgi:hypothetical protein
MAGLLLCLALTKEILEGTVAVIAYWWYPAT